MKNQHDNFLADAVGSRTPHISYGDGFRLGFGFAIGSILVATIFAALTWGLILLLHVK